MGIVVDIGAVNKDFGEVEHVTRNVLAGRHDPGHYICDVDVVTDAQQVLSLPDLYIGIPTDALDQVDVEPVPGQLPSIFVYNTIFAEQCVHRIGIDVFDFFRSGVQVRVKGEVMGCHAFSGDLLHNRSPHLGR